jgi:uncharacterized membrane protein
VDMTNAEGLEPPLLSIATSQNRSLSRRGRGLWLILIATSVFVVAMGATAIGAWLILPFAGIEVFLVWLAFHMVAKHEMDYESLVVTNSEFRWERRDGLKLEKLEGSRHWASVSRNRRTFEADAIYLLYGCNEVCVGRLMSATERRALGARMATVFKCAAK